MFDKFLNSLKRRESNSVFNPWYEYDSENDIDITSPNKRLNNLKCYLNERYKAKYLLVGEALGYQGGHFSGIPITSERIILGHKSDIGVLTEHVSLMPLERTSKIDLKRDGFSEPTATIVWQKLIELNLDTREFVFWNSFPWHPYNSSKGLLSNRTPTELEIKEGEIVLNELLGSIQFKKIIALGNEAYDLLNGMGIEKVNKIRHPANGGAKKFRYQIRQEILT